MVLIAEDRRPQKSAGTLIMKLMAIGDTWEYSGSMYHLERKRNMLHLFSNLTFHIKPICNYFVHFLGNSFVYIYIAFCWLENMLWNTNFQLKWFPLKNKLEDHFSLYSWLYREAKLACFQLLIKYLWRKEIPLSTKLYTLIQHMLYLLEHEFNWQIRAWAILARLLQIKISEVLLLCQSLRDEKK